MGALPLLAVDRSSGFLDPPMRSPDSDRGIGTPCRPRPSRSGSVGRESFGSWRVCRIPRIDRPGERRVRFRASPTGCGVCVSFVDPVRFPFRGALRGAFQTESRGGSRSDSCSSRVRETAKLGRLGSIRDRSTQSKRIHIDTRSDVTRDGQDVGREPVRDAPIALITASDRASIESEDPQR